MSDTMTKVALWNAIKRSAMTPGGILNRVGGTIVQVGTVAGMAAGMGYVGNKVISHRDSAQTQQRFNASLNLALAKNPILANANKEDVKHLAQTVYNLAPHAAGDPNVLSSVLANAIHGAGLDPKTARDLMELEEKHYNIQRMTAPPYTDMARIALTDWQRYDPDMASAIARAEYIPKPSVK